MSKTKLTKTNKFPTIKPEDPWVEVEMNKMKQEIETTEKINKNKRLISKTIKAIKL